MKVARSLVPTSLPVSLRLGALANRLVLHALTKKRHLKNRGDATLTLTLERPNWRNQLDKVAGVFRWDQREWPQRGGEGHADRRLAK